jgi:Uma2 family endonuclease
MSSQSLTFPAPLQPRTRHRFTVDEYEQMIEFGILGENNRVELIRGEVVDKMPIGDRHVACVNRLNRLLSRRVGDRAIVSIQNPVRFPDSEPEADATLLRPREDFYDSGKPRPADVLLLIEVADTSLLVDRDEKRPLYANAGIVEYWIVNLNDDNIEVHRQPRPDGTYADVQTKRRSAHLDIAALPGVTLAVDEVL